MFKILLSYMFCFMYVLEYCDCHVITVDADFNKLKTDEELSKYVSHILERLKVFKVPVHPRIRLFYELLRRGMREHAHRTAASLYVPDMYNVAAAPQAGADLEPPAPPIENKSKTKSSR